MTLLMAAEAAYKDRLDGAGRKAQGVPREGGEKGDGGEETPPGRKPSHCGQRVKGRRWRCGVEWIKKRFETGRHNTMGDGKLGWEIKKIPDERE